MVTCARHDLAFSPVTVTRLGPAYFGSPRGQILGGRLVARPLTQGGAWVGLPPLDEVGADPRGKAVGLMQVTLTAGRDAAKHEPGIWTLRSR
jgi:hypothetical protein